LNVVGLMNIQFAIKGDEIYVLEVNPRASRTVPFVAKATGLPIAKIAARIMAGEQLRDFQLDATKRHHFAVKEAVFPFAASPAWTSSWAGDEIDRRGDGARFQLRPRLPEGPARRRPALPRTGTCSFRSRTRTSRAWFRPRGSCWKWASTSWRRPAPASFLRNQGPRHPRRQQGSPGLAAYRRGHAARRNQVGFQHGSGQKAIATASACARRR
jgi:carbamoyl-phosphate synthase large subunit